MPRRNHPAGDRRTSRPAAAPPDELTTDGMALRLVQRGLASPVILGPTADRPGRPATPTPEQQREQRTREFLNALFGPRTTTTTTPTTGTPPAVTDEKEHTP